MTPDVETSTGAAAGPEPERMARAAWTRLAEPGDPVAWAAIALLGAVPALELVRSGRNAPAETARSVEDLLGVWDISPRAASLGRSLERWRPRLLGLDPERDRATASRYGARVIIPGDAEWPERVDDLGCAAPLALWVRGRADLAASLRRSVAVVGARSSSGYGERVASDFGHELARRGYCVVSGGAFGIDAAAHRAALSAGGSSPAPTVAFLAGGIDHFYPVGNTELFERIEERGLVVAETAPGSASMKQRFLDRNRLIAAVSSATVVVEAGWRSGAFNTARRAAELLRPVAAVPGSIYSATSAGCHRLIRDGAAIAVTDVTEVLELAGAVGEHLPGGYEQPPLPYEYLGSRNIALDYDGLLPNDARLLDALPMRRGAQVPSLQRVAGLSAGEVRSGLSRLEIAGLVVRSGAGWRRARR